MRPSSSQPLTPQCAQSFSTQAGANRARAVGAPCGRPARKPSSAASVVAKALALASRALLLRASPIISAGTPGQRMALIG